MSMMMGPTNMLMEHRKGRSPIPCSMLL